MKLLFSACLSLFMLSSISQQISSPDSFLGYPIGSHYTPHHKVVAYFKKLSEQAPQRMKLETYGFTNEGRELLIAIVSSPENMQRIEEIRKNNLRLAGQLTDKAPETNMPAVIWLSYNVHGNETSSTEVAIKLTYDLVSGNNESLNLLLKNTVVIIDPCLNPDGRDRYVNWFNSISGKNPDIDPIAREHDEPWPGGRSNHYNFDLNRDWCWQTQVETYQRIRQYQQWMPVIHSDYHEQGVSAPYYFAPAAEPFHEVITPWQRTAQQMIGKNNATYFDKNGWLYFTKEIFDLFYPSYGDTWPIYNGSVGMTFEQAGHSSAGISIAVDDDTLTLNDRIAHHYTTSLGTLEIASSQHTKLNEEFKKYFDDAHNNGAGTYKSFVLSGANLQKMEALKQILKNNQISYSYLKTGTAIKGLHYQSGKEETYITQSNDMLVSTYQSSGHMVKVLFEPQSKLNDSVTYDITAWALPYAFGVDGYAVKEKIQEEKIGAPIDESRMLPNQYAYLIPYQSFADGKTLAALLKNNFKVHYAEKDFSIDKMKYKKGTLIVLAHENNGKMNLLEKLAMRSDIQSVNSGFMDIGFDFGSEKVHAVHAPKVALMAGEGNSSTAAGEIWHLFEQQLDYPLTLLNAQNINVSDLKKVNVIIIPDGYLKMMNDKDNPLKNWVREGGKIIALENAAVQLANAEWGPKLKKSDDNNSSPGYQDLKKYEDRERESVSYGTPGSIYKISLDNSHPLAFGYGDTYFTLKMNTNCFEFMKDGWNVGYIKQDPAVAGYVGSNAQEKIKDGTLIGVQEMGKGQLIFFADNPIFRSFWENGKLMFTNAVFLVGQ